MDRERILLERFATDVVLFILSELSIESGLNTGLSPAVQAFIKHFLNYNCGFLEQAYNIYFEMDFITEEEHRTVCDAYIDKLLRSDILENTVPSSLVPFTFLALLGALSYQKGTEKALFDSIEYMVRYLEILKSRGHTDENYLRDVQIFCEHFLES
ncbi:hypothetical protein NPIL_2751 [Nephila pilipes]|uniref:Uncharacterized protein n=1 Tax=Nephila pilipes TaxID=299642 RepID=A0A8X6NYV8_NEPPI|nr:hypothetical protein NPIL_2751 [Nephila pilipes]